MAGRTTFWCSSYGTKQCKTSLFSLFADILFTFAIHLVCFVLIFFLFALFPCVIFCFSLSLFLPETETTKTLDASTGNQALVILAMARRVCAVTHTILPLLSRVPPVHARSPCTQSMHSVVVRISLSPFQRHSSHASTNASRSGASWWR
jgi:hypothetical protein